MNSFLQVLKLNEPRSGVKNDRKWEMQDAECIIFDEHGAVDSVGVLMIPKPMMGLVQPGTFVGSFALRANTSRDGQRRIEAVLTGLQAVKKTANGFVAADAPVTPKAAS
ncbi:MAG TPA: hypothetical protein VGM74_01865 [Burkholderiaceae bacterium]